MICIICKTTQLLLTIGKTKLGVLKRPHMDAALWSSDPVSPQKPLLPFSVGREIPLPCLPLVGGPGIFWKAFRWEGSLWQLARLHPNPLCMLLYCPLLPFSEQSPAFKLNRNTHGLPQKMSKQWFLGSEIPTFDSSITVYLHIHLSVWVCMSHSMHVAARGQPGGVSSLLPRGVWGGLRPSGLAASGLTHRALSPALRCLAFIFSFGALHLTQTGSPSFCRVELYSTLYAHGLFCISLCRGRLG